MAPTHKKLHARLQAAGRARVVGSAPAAAAAAAATAPAAAAAAGAHHHPLSPSRCSTGHPRSPGVHASARMQAPQGARAHAQLLPTHGSAALRCSVQRAVRAVRCSRACACVRMQRQQVRQQAPQCKCSKGMQDACAAPQHARVAHPAAAAAAATAWHARHATAPCAATPCCRRHAPLPRVTPQSVCLQHQPAAARQRTCS